MNSNILFILIAILCPLVFLALVAIVVIVLLKNLSGRSRFAETGTGPRTFGSGDVRVRLAADGFWLDLAGVERGSEVRYRYRMDGQEQWGSVAYEPGPQGQFVYIGGRPTEVQVTEILHPAGWAILPAIMPWPTSRPGLYGQDRPARPPQMRPPPAQPVEPVYLPPPVAPSKPQHPPAQLLKPIPDLPPVAPAKPQHPPAYLLEPADELPPPVAYSKPQHPPAY